MHVKLIIKPSSAAISFDESKFLILHTLVWSPTNFFWDGIIDFMMGNFHLLFRSFRTNKCSSTNFVWVFAPLPLLVFVFSLLNLPNDVTPVSNEYENRCQLCYLYLNRKSHFMPRKSKTIKNHKTFLWQIIYTFSMSSN